LAASAGVNLASAAAGRIVECRGMMFYFAATAATLKYLS